jgi:hypothetical protein
MQGFSLSNPSARYTLIKPFAETHSLTFRKPGFVPRDAFDVTALTKNIAICTQDGIVIADPTKYVRGFPLLFASSTNNNSSFSLARSAVAMVPDLQDAASDIHMSTLKDRLKDAKPLGLVRVDDNELLLIYDCRHMFILATPAWSHILVSDRILYHQTWRSKSFMRLHQMGSSGYWVCPPWKSHPIGLLTIH